jgi:DNA ligase-associated metallophosphoesterase
VAEVRLGDVVMQLRPERCAFLPEQRALLVADAHVGKAVSFRRLGVPVPRGTTTGTLERLARAVAATGARRVVFLGDLLHSAHAHAASTLGAFARFRREHAGLELVLVRGNHDARAGDPPAALGVHCAEEPLAFGGLLLCHHPREHAGGYALAGHVHPAVVLGGRAHDRVRLPCFHFGPRVGLLPAFGEFTGTHVLAPAAGDRVYVCAGDEVRMLPTLAG